MVRRKCISCSPRAVGLGTPDHSDVKAVGGCTACHRLHDMRLFMQPPPTPVSGSKLWLVTAGRMHAKPVTYSY